MRIVLVYPPPWKIPPTGELPENPDDGPPGDVDPQELLSGDILTIPYGLLSLAAQTKQAGHEVTVLNLFSFAWQEVKSIIRKYPADLYGLSCFTSNRRGTILLARLIREAHPEAHIVVGGPHASALPREMLAFCDAIDTVIIGEGEASFAELVERLKQGKSPGGIAGTAFRKNGGITIGRARKRIDDLDRMVSLFDYFNEYILITSRGCPWNCTFCSSAGLWGKKQHAHSPASVLAMLEKMVNGHGQKSVAIKDETFTRDRIRVLEICSGILRRGLNFLWSCDTRADSLDEEMFFMMRRAGCRRISLGVESGSPRILKNLNKQIALDDVRTATATARKFGFQIRFYMIVGSPGETWRTLQESIDFVAAAGPSEVLWNPFTLLPGTREFLRAQQAGEISPELFFTEPFFEYIPLLRHRDNPEKARIIAWLREHSGLQQVRAYSLHEQQDVLRLFPDLHSSYLDLGHAYLREARLDEARCSVQQALGRGFPLPGLVYNYFACIAALQADIRGALENLMRAKELGYHAVVEKNLASAQAWIKSGGLESRLPLDLAADNSFEVTRPKMQPMTPGRIQL